MQESKHKLSRAVMEDIWNKYIVELKQTQRPSCISILQVHILPIYKYIYC